MSFARQDPIFFAGAELHQVKQAKVQAALERSDLDALVFFKAEAPSASKPPRTLDTAAKTETMAAALLARVLVTSSARQPGHGAQPDAGARAAVPHHPCRQPALAAGERVALRQWRRR
jgi:hypothetical protein